MLRLASFTLLRPASVEEALEDLKQNPGAMLLAGGTDLIPGLKRGEILASVVISLKHIQEFKQIRLDEQGQLFLGALISVQDVANAAELTWARAVRVAANSVASSTIRFMGTLGGNLCQDTRCLYYNKGNYWRETTGNCMKTTSEICLVAPRGNHCWATYQGDLAPALMIFNAEVQLISPEGSRRILLKDFYRDDGINYLNKKKEEIVTQVILKTESGWKSTYRKIRPREEIDFPEAGVAVGIRVAKGKICEDARFAITGVASRPYRIREAEEFLISKPLIQENLKRTSEIVYQNVHPMATTYFSPFYKKKIAEVLTLQALQELSDSEK